MDASSLWSALIVFATGVTLLLWPFETSALRKRAQQARLPLGWLAASGLALSNIVISLSLAAAVFYLVMFGPSHLTGDFIGLPWLTCLPALVVGFVAARRISAAYLKWAFGRLAARAH